MSNPRKKRLLAVTAAAAVTENPGFTTATEMQFIASAACKIDLLVWR